jgi:hypothetical protein
LENPTALGLPGISTENSHVSKMVLADGFDV